MSSSSAAKSSEDREFDTGNDSSPDAARPEQDPSDDDDYYAYDYEDDGIESIQPRSNRSDSETGEERHHPDAEVGSDQPAVTVSPNISSIASASFVQLHGQMLQLFETAQSQVVELRQRVDELEEENTEIVRDGEEAYEAREAEMLSRIADLTHENQRLSAELVAKDKDEYQDELLRENAGLLAQIVAMRTTWTDELFAISEERVEERIYLHRLYRAEITSLENALVVAEMSVEDHPTTKFLRAQNADLEHHLEHLKELIYRKGKKSAKNTSAREKLRKLYVADLNSEFERRFEEQDCIAKSKAAGMQHIVSMLRQLVAESERSHSIVETGYSRRVNREHRALVEMDRLQGLLEEHNFAIENQKHIVEVYRELQRPALFWEDFEFTLRKNHITPANELAKTPAVPPSETEDSFEEEATYAASENQLEVSAPAANQLESQYLGKEQVPAQDTTPESGFNDLERKITTLQEELKTLQRQNQSLREDYASAQTLNKKWRKNFEHFMHGAADLQRKDVSKHQIRKGFKHLHKIVKEGELQGF